MHLAQLVIGQFEIRGNVPLRDDKRVESGDREQVSNSHHQVSLLNDPFDVDAAKYALAQNVSPRSFRGFHFSLLGMASTSPSKQ